MTTIEIIKKAKEIVVEKLPVTEIEFSTQYDFTSDNFELCIVIFYQKGKERFENFSARLISDNNHCSVENLLSLLKLKLDDELSKKQKQKQKPEAIQIEIPESNSATQSISPSVLQ